MNKLMIAILMLFSTTLFAQQQMSLEACISYALEHNQNVNSARAGIDMAEARVSELLATGFPQISGNADLANNYIIPTSFLPAQVFDPTAPEGEFIGVQFGTQYAGRATFDLNQMIFNGSYFVGLKAAKTYTELSRKDLISSEIDVIAAVKKAYYSVLVNQERYALVQKNYQRLDSLLRQTKAMYENGFAEKIDVNRIQVQFNNISQAVKNSATGLEVSMKLLKFQMGMPLSESIQLVDKLQTLQFEVLQEDFGNQFNYSDRIEFSKLEVNKALVQLDIKNTRSQYLPSLDFYGNYGASYGANVFNSFVAFGENWVTFGSYGLRLNVPIFDGLMKNKVVQQKRWQLKQVEFSQDMVKNQIDLEQQQLNLQFSNNLDALHNQEENMKLAEEVYNIAVIKYQQGVGSNIEVIDADASFKEAQTNYFSALYDAIITTVDLEKAYGKLTNKK
ncbi:MAG: TolC family protein [Cyclobacteriaceae bacterium]|nr:TolC family protein [Cyclobacteriaceae bacterium]